MRCRQPRAIGVCLIALVSSGCVPAATLTLPSTPYSSEPAPDGAIYRSFYRGGVEGFMTSPVRWLDDGDGFEVTITGGGNCPVVPVSLSASAPDRVVIEMQRQTDGSGLCQEDAALWSFVLDTPAELDTTTPVSVDIVLETSTSTETLQPRVLSRTDKTL